MLGLCFMCTTHMYVISFLYTKSEIDTLKLYWNNCRINKYEKGVNRNGHTNERKSIAPDKVQSLGEVLIKEQEYFKECVACESHIINENMEGQKNTLSKDSMLKLC